MGVKPTGLWKDSAKCLRTGSNALQNQKKVKNRIVMYIPNLHPYGITLNTVCLGADVYALMASEVPRNNSGFIIGRDGILVVDSQINPYMARKLIKSVREISDLPIIYLVNSSHMGDHSFGNSEFPSATKIIAHRKAYSLMAEHEIQKNKVLYAVGEDTKVLESVSVMLPDMFVDSHIKVDLGERMVDIYHFGECNSETDLVVYDKKSRIAFTGNVVLGNGLLPPIYRNNISNYIKSLISIRRSLDIKHVVPGHGRIVSREIILAYISYLEKLHQIENESLINDSYHKILEDIKNRFPTCFYMMSLQEEEISQNIHQMNIERSVSQGSVNHVVN
jgi:glyoxylase-like metal-dependent hydrolase (beta-lactamase superfamily II)